jgi:hypothetical protein
MTMSIITLGHYAERRYGECRYAEYRHDESCYAECRYAECRHDESCYAECRYAKCRGSRKKVLVETGNPYLRGRISTVDHLVLTSSDRQLLILQNISSFFYKTRYLNEEVNCP